nr:zinc finger, CCHC-type [Tanacetum cinerariifolium]
MRDVDEDLDEKNDEIDYKKLIVRCSRVTCYYMGWLTQVGNFWTLGSANTNQINVKKLDIENLNGDVVELTLWDEMTQLERFKLRSDKVCLVDDKTLDIASFGDVVLKTSFGTSWTPKDVRIGMSMLVSKGNIQDIWKVDIYFCKLGVGEAEEAFLHNVGKDKETVEVKCLKFDNGGEYSSRPIKFCVENRLSEGFWGEAMLTACYILLSLRVQGAAAPGRVQGAAPLAGVVYVLSTPSPEWSENENLETTRKRMKWENDDYICHGHILNVDRCIIVINVHQVGVVRSAHLNDVIMIIIQGEASNDRGPGAAPLVAGSKGQRPWLGPEWHEDGTLETTRKKMKWENDDYICRGHILNGMSDSLFDIYQNIGSTKELWESLESKYMAEDASSKKFLVSNYMNYKMVDTKPVMEQFHEMLRILGHHIRIEEGLRNQKLDNNPKGKNQIGSTSVNMVEGD